MIKFYFKITKQFPKFMYMKIAGQNLTFSKNHIFFQKVSFLFKLSYFFFKVLFFLFNALKGLLFQMRLLI